MNQESKQRKHYNMIVGEIVFKGGNDDNVNAIRVNGVMLDDSRDIPVKLLGKAQQILQLNFHQRMQDENVVVLDVVLINFLYLGHMTQEEFNQVPEGTQLQEAPLPQPVADLETAVAQAGHQPAANADTNEA